MILKALQRLSFRRGILRPLRQSSRCLNIWMKESGRHLSHRDRRRVAGLMARYFHYEDQVTDQLMLSFLRHYAGQREIDMEDPASVRLEIKTILDRATARPQLAHPAVFALCVVLVVSMTSYFLWDLSRMTVTPDQQAALKMRVEKVSALQHDVSRTAVWARVKKPFNASRYEDISYWDYGAARKMLDDWIAKLSAGM